MTFSPFLIHFDLVPVFLSSRKVIIPKNRGPHIGEDAMRKKTFSEEQIALALRDAETGTPVTEVCRKMGVSEQSFYRWKKKYMGMGIAELRRLRQLEEENRKLKGIVADLTLDKRMLQDVLSKKV
jgi:putative transposase